MLEGKRLFPDENTPYELITSHQTGQGRAWIDTLQRLVDDAVHDHELHPVISDDIEEDFRFKMGVVAGLRRALNLPKNAADFVKQREKRG